jgi:nuclear pore complex protein Nup93
MASATSSSLFGGGGLGTTAQSSSLFSTNNTITQAPPAGSIFGAQPQAQQQSTPSLNIGQSQAQTSATQDSRPSHLMTQPAFFNSLLERGKKRPLSTVGQSSNYEELPSLQLGLDDIRRKARELGNGGAKDFRQPVPNSKACVVSSSRKILWCD